MKTEQEQDEEIDQWVKDRLGFPKQLRIKKQIMKIDLAEQYRLFLDRMALDETKMPAEQKKQIKQTFYFTWAQCLITVRDTLGSDEVSEEAAMESLQDQIHQVSLFIDTIMGRQS